MEQDSSPWDSFMETSILELFISMKEAHWIRKLDREWPQLFNSELYFVCMYVSASATIAQLARVGQKLYCPCISKL